MASSVGTLAKAALMKEPKDSSYPYSPAANFLNGSHQIPILNEGLSETVSKQVDESLLGKSGLQRADLIGRRVAGPISCQGCYNGLTRLIVLAMGFENPNDPGATYHGSPESMGGGYYKHVFECDEHMSRQVWQAGDERYPSGAGGGTWTASDQKVRSFTLGIAKQISDWRFRSVMVQKMSIKIAPSRITFDFDVVGYDVALGDYNSTNWTPISGSAEANLLFQDLEVKIGTFDGTTLPWQTIGIAEAELVLENNLQVDEQTTVSGLYIEEPERDGQRKVTGSFKFLRYKDNNLLARLNANDVMKMWFKFTSGNYVFGIYFPRFTFDEITAPVSGPGMVNVDHKFTCERLGDYTDPFSSEWSNIELLKKNEMVIMIVNLFSYNVLTEN